MSRYSAKLGFVFLALCWFSNLAWAAPSCTTTPFGALSGSTGNVNTTGASGIFIMSVGFNVPIIPSDSLGNQYNALGLYGAGNGPQAMFWWASGPGLLTSATTTFAAVPSPSTSPGMIIFVCTGTLPALFPLSKTGGYAGTDTTGATTFTTGSVTPYATGDLVISAAGTNTPTFTITSGPAGFTTTSVNNACCEGVAAGWEVAPSTVAINPSWTMSGNTDWVGETVVIKAAADLPPVQTYGPTINLKVGAPSALSGLATETDTCSPTTGTGLTWPGQGQFDSAGNFVWQDVNGNYMGVLNLQSTTQTLYGVSVGPGCIKRIAGQANFTVGFNYSNTPMTATAVQLAHPVGEAIDSSNNVYVADQQNHRILEITPAGQAFTAAGAGPGNNTLCSNGAFGGDGQIANSSTVRLNCPQGVAIEDVPGGTLLCIADTTNSRIRCVNQTATTGTFFNVSICAGCIQTIVGTGIGSTTGNGGQGISATVHAPLEMTFYNGTLYWAEFFPNQVRSVAPSGIVSLFACNGTAGWVDGAATTTAQCTQPYAISFDNNGVGYIADTSNSAIRMVKNGIVSTIAGNIGAGNSLVGTAARGGSGPWGGPAVLTSFIPNIHAVQGPIGATPDNKGNLWVTNTGGGQILEMNLPCFGSCVQ